MPTDSQFRMIVEDVFSLRGRGTVVTGHIEQGSIRAGDVVEVKGPSYTREVVVAAIEMFRKQIERAGVGDHVGLLLEDIAKDEVQRADVLSGSGWEGKPVSESCLQELDRGAKQTRIEQGDKVESPTPVTSPDGNHFTLPEGYSWFQFKRQASKFTLVCRNCDTQVTLKGNDQNLSSNQEEVELIPTGETDTMDTPFYQKMAKILAAVLAIIIGTLIGSVLLSVPFLWAIIALFVYVVLKPVAAFMISRIDPGLTLQIWFLKCPKCGQEQFVAPGKSVIYFAVPHTSESPS